MPDTAIASPPSTADLVRRAQDGDTAAFEVLYRQHAGRVYALCLRMTADATRATTLTQDAFVRAWQHLPSFRGESAFGSWLHRVAVNVVLGAMRAHRRRTARLQPTDDLERYDRAAPTEASNLDLERAIAALPPQARAVLVLHEIEGYRHDEIADLLGIAAGTSKAHLHRARRLLRDALDR